MKTHSGEKSNKCGQCNYASSEASTLRKHLKMHTGEKNKRCNQCDYASYNSGNLMTHLKTHSGEKQNKCNQCNYASSEAGNLSAHLSLSLWNSPPSHCDDELSGVSGLICFHLLPPDLQGALLLVKIHFDLTHQNTYRHPLHTPRILVYIVIKCWKKKNLFYWVEI